MVLKERIGGYGVDAFGPRQRLVPGSCEHDNEWSNSVKSGKYLLHFGVMAQADNRRKHEENPETYIYIYIYILHTFLFPQIVFVVYSKIAQIHETPCRNLKA
jgi:hypothetical protein